MKASVNLTEVNFSGEVNALEWRVKLLAECYHKSVAYYSFM